MRPNKLEIEGFTSFRERISIDFSTLGLFAITGPTGAGKTSIIDAMTYVLYGCTPRIGEKQVRELISQGMQRVKVLLEFSSNRNKYRISRTGKWTGKAMITELRFEQADREEWTLLADYVQKAKPIIESVIGLDFDGFTKSVILPQGRFDEFLKGKADDRRKILSDLLNLDVYNRMMKSANAIAREHQNQASFLQNQLKTDYVDATPENVESLGNQLSGLQPQLATIDARLETFQKALPLVLTLQQDRTEHAKAENEIKGITPKEQAAEKTLSAIRARIAELQKNLADVEARIQSNQYDQQLHLKLSSDLQKIQGLVKLNSDIETLEKTLKEKNLLLKRFVGEEKTLKVKQEQIRKDLGLASGELQKHREELKLLQQRYGSVDAIKAQAENLKQLRKQQKKLSETQSQLKQSDRESKKTAEELTKLKEQLTKAQSRFADAQSELRNLERRHAADALRSELKSGEQCPVCEQEVSTVPKTTRHASLEKANSNCEQAGDAVRAIDKQITDARIESAKLQKDVDGHHEDLNHLTETIHELELRYQAFTGISLADDSETHLKRLSTEMEECMLTNNSLTQAHDEKKGAESNAISELNKKTHQRELVDNEITSIRNQIDQRQAESEALRKELEGVDNLESLQTALAAQQRACAERERLSREHETHSSNLSRAKDELAPAQSHYDSLVQSRNSKQHSIKQLQHRIAENSDQIERLVPSVAPSEFEKSIRNLQSDRNKLQTDIIRLQEKIQSLEQKIVRASELREQLESHRTKFNEANDLAQLLHGDNFIAFIQQEAYRRLAFDGSAHLKSLSSERYSFTVRNEDFHVIDNWNAGETRPVNTLSGGESFLASLALALALAEGLSGMSSGHTKFALESLFLDEGFGTLDPETLEVVVSGIEALSLNDRLIGIISHLPDLAERMLSRIVIGKSPTGSTIEVS